MLERTETPRVADLTVPQLEALIERAVLRALDKIEQVWGYVTADIDYGPIVKPTSDQPDYRINATDILSFLLDAKRLGEDLNKHAPQMVKYLAASDARWGVLCNGRELQVYDDNATGTASEKKVLEVSLVDYKDDEEFNRVADLLAAKLLNVGQKIYAKYKSYNYEASVEADGNIMFNGVSYPSLSSAGRAAREDACLKLGETRQLQTNGWMFWRYEDEDGKRKPLSDLRDKLKAQ